MVMAMAMTITMTTRSMTRIARLKRKNQKPNLTYPRII